MTEEEKRDAALMRLIRKNETQRAKVACLESQVSDFVEPLRKLANAIDSNPSSVTPSNRGDAHFLLQGVSQPTSPGFQDEHVEVDIGRLRLLVGDLQDAWKEQEKIASCMERGGLKRYI